LASPSFLLSGGISITVLACIFKDSVTQLNVDDEIVIYYNGDIAETYPAEIDTVYAITLK
jgi:hypothetical protein